jgi:cell wall-associated NlpC family hydrolase
MASCGSTRNTRGYDYLREKSLRKTEPYAVVDLSVLDTARNRPAPKPKPEPTPKPKPSATASANKTAKKAISKARDFLGVPYRFGGMSRKGMDCSGLMVLAYRAAGVELPRTSSLQSKTGKRLKKSQVRPGDLLFFDSNLNGKINHVGLVTEVKKNDVVFIHATTSRGVVEDRMSNRYYQQRYKRAMRPD